MPKPKVPRALKNHYAAVHRHLMKRVPLSLRVGEDKQHGRSVAAICRRRKVTPRAIKVLLKEFRQIDRYANIGCRLRMPEEFGSLPNDEKNWAALEKRATKQVIAQSSPAGLKKALAQDPAKASVLEPIHLHWVAITLANEARAPWPPPRRNAKKGLADGV